MRSQASCYVSLRELLFVLFVAALGFTTSEMRLDAQDSGPTTCNSTTVPCVLTAGYAGPATDASFNSRQGINSYETHISLSNVGSIGQTGYLFEVDDSAYPVLPINATSNPIMAQPLYVANTYVTNNPNLGYCNSSSARCNMLIGATLNDTVFAWVADGTNAGNLLWSRQGTGGLTGTNALSWDDCSQTGSGPAMQGQVVQFEGILSTPVIDKRVRASNVPDIHVQ